MSRVDGTLLQRHSTPWMYNSIQTGNTVLNVGIWVTEAVVIDARQHPSRVEAHLSTR